MANSINNGQQDLTGTVPKPSEVSNIRMRIEKKLDVEFPGSTIKLEDMSGGCGTSMHLTIASDAFDSVSNRLKRSRMVNHVLKEEIAELHAFQLNTHSMAQLKALKANDAANDAAKHEKNTAAKQ